MEKIIELSVLALDQKDENKFKEQLESCLKNNIKDIHYDIMDNKFVPNTSFNNLEFLDYLIEKGCNVSAHLMVENVAHYVDKLITKKVKYITFHCEVQTIEESISIINTIKKHNIKAGIAIKPNSSLKEYESLIKISDKITVMSVEPGFGGQKYIENSEIRIREIKKLSHKNLIVEIDGGINDQTILLCKDDATHFVTGSFLFNNLEKFEELKKLLD